MEGSRRFPGFDGRMSLPLEFVPLVGGLVGYHLRNYGHRALSEGVISPVDGVYTSEDVVARNIKETLKIKGKMVTEELLAAQRPLFEEQIQNSAGSEYSNSELLLEEVQDYDGPVLRQREIDSVFSRQGVKC